MKKFILIIVIIAAITTIMALPIIKTKSECQKWDELNDYLFHCENNVAEINKKYPWYSPELPMDCREYRDERNPVIWKNWKEYQNSCYACRDCQKYFYNKDSEKISILKLIINKLKN